MAEKNKEKNKVQIAWIKLEKQFGPAFDRDKGQSLKLCKAYADAILEENDEERIDVLGKKHLKKLSEKILTGKELGIFIQHARALEKRKKNLENLANQYYGIDCIF